MVIAVRRDRYDSDFKSLPEAEERFDRRAEYFASHHPVMAFWTMFVGIPLFILMTVSASTLVLTLPFAMVFGWY